MIILYVVLYFIAFIATFYYFVYDDKKKGHYIPAGALFFYTIMCVIWPATWLIIILMLGYQQLESWVNK